MKGWFRTSRPPSAGTELWVSPEDAESAKAAGRDPIVLDGFADCSRTIPRADDRSLGAPKARRACTWRGRPGASSPWTREAGAGNVWIAVDQFRARSLYEGTPEDGNVFDQAVGATGASRSHR